MNEQKILVIGSEGLVGTRFVEISKYRTGLHYPKLAEFDITNKEELKAVLESYEFSAIVNFAAFTNVNEAENEKGNKTGDVWKVNVDGPRNIAEALTLSGKNIPFIHISTDMVFSGGTWDPGPYKEDHKIEENPDKLTWYGYTKGQGEKAVREVLDGKAVILRLIYPVRAKFDAKLDYIRKPLSLFDENKLYTLFSNQQISISFIDQVAEVIDALIDQKVSGVFHASSPDTTTPLELVKYVLDKTGRDSKILKSVKLEDFLKISNSPEFRYPKFGGLEVRDTEKKLGIKFKSWKEIVDILVEQGLGRN